MDHIRFYVRDVAAKAADFGQRYGLDLVLAGTSPGPRMTRCRSP
ncbi:hypothetical protein NKG94_03495 [Micromonospora sp. M12]